jgi:inhibitor of cysteine peptidase
MKKWIIMLLVTIALFGLILSGCSSAVKAYTDPAQVINISANQEFTIALGSNITTGYSWQPKYDVTALTLIGREYKANDTTSKQIVGSGGTEYFHFKASKTGEIQVSFSYYRPWETPTPQDQNQSFTIEVK